MEQVTELTVETLDKVVTNMTLWGCGANYNEETGEYENYFDATKEHPYLAICKSNNKKDRVYLEAKRISYSEFDVSAVKKGDILLGGFFSSKKGYSLRTEYYLVLKNNKKEGLVVADGAFTTYLKAYKYKKSISKSRTSN